MKKGDLMVLDGKLVHKTNTNATKKTRYAYTWHTIDKSQNGLKITGCLMIKFSIISINDLFKRLFIIICLAIFHYQQELFILSNISNLLNFQKWKQITQFWHLKIKSNGEAGHRKTIQAYLASGSNFSKKAHK